MHTRAIGSLEVCLLGLGRRREEVGIATTFGMELDELVRRIEDRRSRPRWPR